MKIKLSWIILAFGVVSIGGYVIPRMKGWIPSSPGSSEPARAEQATPEATVNAMFQMTDQGGAESDNPNDVINDRLDYGHLLAGKDMTPEEQKFAALFWDNQRSGAIYAPLRSALAKSARVTGNETHGDSAVVSVALQIFPDHASDWVDYNCTVDLKKRGPNWYVDDVKTPKVPGGIYHGFKQRLDAMH